MERRILVVDDEEASRGGLTKTILLVDDYRHSREGLRTFLRFTASP